MLILKKPYYYFKFIRPFAFIGSFIVIICASLIAVKVGSGTCDWSIILIGAFTCGLLTSAAYSLNNIYDLKADKINKPFRPLSSGLINIKEAWIITVFFYSLSIIFSLFINQIFFFLILVMFFFTIFYSVSSFNVRRNSILANFIIALLRGLLIFVAGWSLFQDINFVLPWYIGFISFLYLLGAVSTKDITDVLGDRQSNYSTFFTKYDFIKSVKIVSPFFIFPFFLIPLGVYIKILDIKTLPLTLLSLYGIYIIWLLKNKPYKLTKIENNHIAWKHSYILYMILQIGMCIAYVV